MQTEQKYKTLSDFRKAHPNDYHYLYRNGLLKKLCDDMGWFYTEKKFWQKEECIVEAKKYETKTEWRNNCPSYQAALRHGWLDECTTHMINGQKKRGYWTKERCIEYALKYETISDWAKNSSTSYTLAMKKGWGDDCTKHMFKSRGNRISTGHWNDKNNCILEALKYTSRTEWFKASASCVRTCKKNGWYDECSAHMVYGKNYNKK